MVVVLFKWVSKMVVCDWCGREVTVCDECKKKLNPFEFFCFRVSYNKTLHFCSRECFTRWALKNKKLLKKIDEEFEEV